MTNPVQGVRLTLWAAAFAAALIASPVAAQDRLVLGGYELQASGAGFGSTVGPAGALAGTLAGGGSHGVLYDRVIERATGREIRYPWPLIRFPIAADPARPRAFFARGVPLAMGEVDAVLMADLTTGALTPLMEFSPRLLVSGRFAVDAQRLVVLHSDSNGGDAHWVVVDLAGATPVVRALDLPSLSPSAQMIAATSWLLSPDGTRLFRVEFPSPTPPSLVAYDVSTGVEVARTAMPLAFGGVRLVQSDALDGILVSSQPLFTSTDTVFQLLSGNLATLATLSMPTRGKCGPVDLVVSPSTGRVYTFTGGGTVYSTPFYARLTAVTPGVANFQETDIAPQVKSPCSALQVASPPGAPRRVTASVHGHEVSLQWNNVGAASRFTVDVGVAPGRTDLSIPLGPNSQTSFAGVPSGVYYLRLRGSNAFGGGRESSEIRVVVP